MAVLLGAIQKNSTTIEKRVNEINDMIRYANANDIEVVDNRSTWQSPMRYNPLLYTKGVLYVSYAELDLYRANRGGSRVYENKVYRVGKNDVKETLTDIARMYRSAINKFKKYGY